MSWASLPGLNEEHGLELQTAWIAWRQLAAAADGLQMASTWSGSGMFHRQPLQAIYGLLGHGTSAGKVALSDFAGLV